MLNLIPYLVSILIVLAFFALLLLSGLAMIPKHAAARTWIYAGLGMLAGLLLPTHSLMRFDPTGAPLERLLWTVAFGLPILVPLGAAFLIGVGLDALGSRQARAKSEPAQSLASLGWTAWVAFVLAAALLARLLYNLYWLIVWDTTYDPLDLLWLILPGCAALVASGLLAFGQTGWRWLSGLYGPLLILAMVVLFNQARQTDFRALTEARAGQVSRAIETYHARRGAYPERLSQLTPWTVVALPEPVFIAGLDWCYQAGPDGYRLGYLTRQHWSAPVVEVRVYKTAGTPPEPSSLCQDQKAALEARYPGFFAP